MSKKVKERASESEHIALGLSTATEEQNAVDESIHSKRSGILTYIKNPSHWWVIGLIALFTLGAMGAGLKYLEESAQKQRAANNQGNESFLSSLNPFVTTPPPSPTPTPIPLSKEYVYAGSRMLAVEDAGASAEPPADLAFWRPSNGNWYVLDSQGTRNTGTQFGVDGQKPVPGDYDGDGKTDFAVYDPLNGIWHMMRSTLGYGQQQFGGSTYKPAPADYDGDGKTDFGLYLPSNGVWYLLQSTAGYREQQFGGSDYTPVPADYDGDGKADFALYRPSTGVWYMLCSTSGYGEQLFGQSGDTPVQADYDGDGKADFAVRRGNSWIIHQSSNPNDPPTTTTWQLAADVAVHNDYDGDGKVDIAVWRSATNATWYIKNSSTGATRTETWGTTGDIPVPAFYRR